jgi:thiamine-monophosphate kinase
MQQPRNHLPGCGQKPRLKAATITLAQAGEAGLLRALKGRMARTPPAWGKVTPIVGIGDDAAVLRTHPHAVVSCDMVVEDVDFRRIWATWRDVGHKAAAINVSDLAAMGADPRGLIVGLAAGANESVSDMATLLHSVHRTGALVGAPLVGGDLSRTRGPVVVSVTALGAVRGTGMRRHLGEPGDIIVVTGALGGAAAGLALLEDPASLPNLPASVLRALVLRQLRPNAQVEVAKKLLAWGHVRSCADVSDGLGTDAWHVVLPGCGLCIDTDAVPVQRGVAQVAAMRGTTALHMAMFGGEDFELVLAIAPKHVAKATQVAKKMAVALTPVGQVTARRGLTMVGRAADLLLRGHGFDHYT